MNMRQSDGKCFIIFTVAFQTLALLKLTCATSRYGPVLDKAVL